MDLIDKGIKGRREHRHLHAASEAREQRLSRDSAVPAQTANPEIGGPVAATSFASVRESPAPLREVAATITFLTKARASRLRKMSNPAASLARGPAAPARGPAAQEGGPR